MSVKCIYTLNLNTIKKVDKMNLEQLKENLENELINYDNFAKLVNNDNSITISEFFELMNDNIAELIQIEDFTLLEDYTSTIRENIESEFRSDSMSEYSYNPSEDGGTYTDSLLLNNPDLGILGDLMNVSTVAEIKIDFRPSCYIYVGVHFIKDAYSDKDSLSLLGEYNYLHYEVNHNGDLLNSSIESM